MSATKINQLNSQFKILVIEADNLRINIANQQRELAIKMKAISEIERKINQIKRKDKVKITDHAIVRYLERVKGINIKDIENEIITPNVAVMINTLGGSGKYPNGEFKVVMKDYDVVTII